MIRAQYLANFAGDVAVTTSDIKKMCTVPLVFFPFWSFGLMDFKKPLKCNYFYWEFDIPINPPMKIVSPSKMSICCSLNKSVSIYS